MVLTKRSAMAPDGAFCFGCNRGFGQGSPAVVFATDLVPDSDRAEVAGLYFHPGHLIRYAHRRNWTELANYIEAHGALNF